MKIHFSKTYPYINDENINVNDMTSLKEINEIDILNNLTNRFIESNKIFTNIGSLLIILNPNKKLEKIYSNKKIEYYIEEHKGNNPQLRKECDKPHLFDLIIISMENLFINNKNQSIIINGENGSGKTENFKYSINCILYYFLGKNNKERKENYEKNYNENFSIEKKIICSNKILESFGNCKTLLNDNSSRFGKYINIYIDINKKKIKKAFLKTYLLEKTRITQLTSQERNFHIFYQIIFCENDFLLKKLFLTNDPSKYNYLNKNKAHKINSINDNELFDETIESFKIIGFSQDEIDSILKTVVSVLLIGNITFISNNNKIEIENYNIIKDICELLNCDEKYLILSLESNFTVKESENYKNFLAEEIYLRLFIWIVKKINYYLYTCFDKEEEDNNNIKYISLLDFFGFENFDNNSLEQLCINYSYEKIHHLFLKQYFESEIKDFKKEGLNDKIKYIKYKNNQNIIDLIELKTNSLFSILDDCSYKNNSIEEFVHITQKFLKKNKGITFTNNLSDINIYIKHTPKEVIYNLTDFIFKNQIDLKKSMIKIFLNSKNEIIKSIFFGFLDDIDLDSIENYYGKKSIIELKLVCGNFRNKINELINEIKLCECHFILCLKSNEIKKPFYISPKFLFNQIRSLDLLHFTKIIRENYIFKKNFQNFIKEFEILNSEYKNTNINDSLLVNKIIKDLIPEIEELNSKENNPLFLCGKNKLFLKKDFYLLLENKKNELLKEKIIACGIIITSLNYLRKKEKIEKYEKNILQLQTYLNIYKFIIPRKKKINEIYKIQSIYHSYKQKEKYINTIKAFKNLSFFCKTIIKKQQFEKNIFRLKCLNLRLIYFLERTRKKEKKVINLISNNIVRKSVDNIIYKEYNDIWQKLNPFFIKFLVNKKYIKIIELIRIKNNDFCKNLVFETFLMKLLFRKIQNKKKSMIFIKNYSILKQSKKYYKKMIDKVYIIQSYLLRNQNKKKSFNKIINEYFEEDNNNKNYTDNIIEKEIFTSINKKEKEEKKIIKSVKNLLSLNSIKIKERNSSMKNLHKNKLGLSVNNIKNISKEKDRKIKEILPNYDEYNLTKINLFVKILSIDSIINFSEIYEKNWGEEYYKIYKKNMELNSPIQKISIGNYHTILLNSKGKIFCWGWNNNNQLGTNKEKENIENIILNKEIKKLPILSYQNYEKINQENLGLIINCCCNEESTFIINNKGEVYYFGKNNKKSKLIDNLNKNFITDIQSTNKMTFALNKNNEVYYWFNLNEKDFKIENESLKILNVTSIKIKQISCGYNFCMLLSKNGILYSMGNNNKGELGLTDNKNDIIKYNYINKPVENLFFSNIYKEKVINVKCGFKHTICIISSGKIFGWGNNSFGQLGLNNYINNIIYPININIEKYIINDKVIQINCGFRSSIFFTENRKIFYSGILDKENKSFFPKKFIIKNKSNEISDEYKFCPVKIQVTWNKNASIFYITFADIRLVYNKLKNINKVWKIIGQLSKNWKDDSIICPYIPNIRNYFFSSVMKKE